MTDRNRLRILLAAVGPIDPSIMPVLATELSCVFRAHVSTGNELPVPADAMDPARRQYRAELVAQAIVRSMGSGRYDRVLALFSCDLYTPGLNFVFGIANGHLALVSLARLRQEFYGLVSDRQLFNRRVLTEAVHELGHTFGLNHCHDPACVMFFSNTLADTDRKGSVFCTRCMQKLGERIARR